MERLPAYIDTNKNRYTLQASTSKYFVLDLAKANNPVTLDVFVDLECDLLLLNVKEKLDITINIQSNSYLRLCLLGKNALKTCKITDRKSVV